MGVASSASTTQAKPLPKAQQKVQSSDSYYLIYSLDGCPFCIRAEKLLEQHNLLYKAIRITQTEKQKYKEYLKAKTFPQIYYVKDDEPIPIGGCSDLEKYLTS
jgi:glutaredoxin